MQPTRRTVLAGGALGLVTACTSEPPRVASPDERRLQEAAIREEALLQLYDAALAAFPALAPALAPLREDHVQHRKALRATTPVATAAPGLVGKTPAEARKRLAALERSTATSHASEALRAGRALAPLLASISACEASHVGLL